MKHALDQKLATFVSKKLMVFGIACFLVWLGSINGSEWVEIAKIYIGGQAIVDTAKAIRGDR